MYKLPEIWKYFKLTGDPDPLSKEELAFVERFLATYQLREKKRIQYLMRALESNASSS